MPADDANFLGVEDGEVSDAAEERVKGQSQQAPAADAMLGYTEAELSSGKRLARTQIDSFHAIHVVAYENERGAHGEDLSIGVEADFEEGKTPQGRHRGPEKSNPLALAQTAPLLALGHQRRIQTQPRIVEKGAAIHFGHIHEVNGPGPQVAHRALQIERQFQILGEVI